MLDLGQQFPPDWPGIPPHMSARDFAIWRPWHETHWPRFSGFYFDTALGTPIDLPPGGDQKMLAAMIRLTLKRIDALGIQKDRVLVIEVRPSASSSAAGAVLLYTFLLQKENPFSLPLAPHLISDLITPDDEAFFLHYGITWDLVGPVLTVPLTPEG